MQNRVHDAVAERIGDRGTASRQEIALLDVRAVAAMLGCSPRHVYRLADAARMPRPVRLGGLVRWCRAALELWIADGCPPYRPRGAADDR
jgi:predicted DNA-binding transcriptional regulator AlpA